MCVTHRHLVLWVNCTGCEPRGKREGQKESEGSLSGVPVLSVASDGRWHTWPLLWWRWVLFKLSAFMGLVLPVYQHRQFIFKVGPLSIRVCHAFSTGQLGVGASEIYTGLCPSKGPQYLTRLVSKFLGGEAIRKSLRRLVGVGGSNGKKSFLHLHGDLI